MPDLRWGAAIAVGIQSGFGAINTTIRDLGPTEVTNADGLILGDKDSGTGESGITIPTHTRDAIEYADVPGGFTKIPNGFVRELATGLQIAFPLKGNGALPTGAFGESVPDPGIDALFQAAGLVGVAGGADDSYTYTPAGALGYVTIKLWLGANATVGVLGEIAAVYQDCVVDTLTIAQTGGEAAIVTASVTIGSVPSVDNQTFPPLDYGAQATLSPPLVQDAAFTYGKLRCFQELEVSIANSVETFSCSNAANGIRLDLSERTISANGSLMIEDSIAAATPEDGILHDHDQLVQLDSTQLATATWNYGEGDEAAGGFNQVYYDCTALQLNDLTWDRAGSLMTSEIQSHCVDNNASPTVGGEFTLRFN